MNDKTEMSDEDISKLNIYQRINMVRKEVEYIQKDKEVQGYKVVTHDAVTKAIRPSLIKYGVVIVPYLVEDIAVQDTGMSTKNDVPIIRYEAKYKVSFVNADKPDDFIETMVSGHALDQGDKAPGKAISYAVKTAMLKISSMETGEEEEERVKAESNRLDKVMACATAVQKYFDDIHEIKFLLSKDDQIEAAKIWFDIPKDDKENLWLAPTKGGIFSTTERAQMVDNDFRKTLGELHTESGEPTIDPTENSGNPSKLIKENIEKRTLK